MSQHTDKLPNKEIIRERLIENVGGVFPFMSAKDKTGEVVDFIAQVIQEAVMAERSKINMAIYYLPTKAPFMDRQMIDWVKGYFQLALSQPEGVAPQKEQI